MTKLINRALIVGLGLNTHQLSNLLCFSGEDSGGTVLINRLDCALTEQYLR